MLRSGLAIQAIIIIKAVSLHIPMFSSRDFLNDECVVCATIGWFTIRESLKFLFQKIFKCLDEA
jgi:hypothetical protein